MQYRRYAIYYAPPADHPLGRFGAAWLGWDAERGEEVVHPPLPIDVARLTATPRKYGFHGTLKPPMRLTTEPADFLEAVAALAGRIAPFEMPALVMRRLGPFLALVPDAPSAALQGLAGACVTELDRFRAPPTEAEITKRRKLALTQRQEMMLAQWGYPYVLEEFRFHLTLTGAFEPDTLEEVSQALSPVLETPLAVPLPCRELCLFGEAEDGRFHLLTRFPLGG